MHIADKVLITVLSLSLWTNGTLPSYAVGLWWSKDIILLAGGVAFYVQSHRPTLQPTLVSKVNTALQFGTIGVAMMDSMTTSAGTILQAVLPLTCVTTVASLTSYYDQLLLLLRYNPPLKR